MGCNQLVAGLIWRRVKESFLGKSKEAPYLSNVPVQNFLLKQVEYKVQPGTVHLTRLQVEAWWVHNLLELHVSCPRSTSVRLVQRLCIFYDIELTLKNLIEHTKNPADKLQCNTIKAHLDIRIYLSKLLAFREGAFRAGGVYRRQGVLLYYESTGDLGRERAYLRRLWTDQYSEVLDVTATELSVF